MASKIEFNKCFSSFSTNDIEKAKEFYGETLGLKLDENQVGMPVIHMEDGNRIMIYPKEDHVPATFTVLNFLVEDIEETVDELAKRGIIFEQYGGEINTNEKGISKMGDIPGIAWFKDPAGNILSVLEVSS